MSHILLVSQQVAVLFLLMAVGFACRRLKYLNDVAVKGIIELLVVIVTPAVIVNVFSRPFNAAELGGLFQSAILALIIHVVGILMAECLFRREKDDTRVVLRLASVFSNSGFMGIPMEKAILGDIGVFYGVVYMVVFHVVLWSYGLRRMKKSRVAPGESLKMMFVNPGTIGIALGLIVFLLPGTLPEVLARPIDALSDLNTPLAMIVIGYYLADTRLVSALSSRGTLLALSLQLVAMPLVFLALAYPFVRFGFDAMPIKALLIAVSAPTAAMVSMFAAKYDRDVETSVALVSSSTALSMLTMPPIIVLALTLY